MGSNAGLAVDEVQEVPALQVKEKHGFKGVFAAEDIKENSIIFYLKGIISSQPTKYTIQIGRQRHLTLPTTRKANDDLDYCWQYLNHSCEPNGYLNAAELTFHALRDIAAGEEITFNYLTTESEMAMPFTCACGSTNCFGLIQGRDFLTEVQAESLARSLRKDDEVITLVKA